MLYCRALLRFILLNFIIHFINNSSQLFEFISFLCFTLYFHFIALFPIILCLTFHACSSRILLLFSTMAKVNRKLCLMSLRLIASWTQNLCYFDVYFYFYVAVAAYAAEYCQHKTKQMECLPRSLSLYLRLLLFS